MLRFIQVGVLCIATLIAALICCFEFAGVQFWLLEPHQDGFVGMGILIFILFTPTAALLVPVSFVWLKQALASHSDPGIWWKRSLGLVLVVTLVLSAISWMQLIPLKPARIAAWIFSWGSILYELLPLQRRFWGIL